MAARNRLIPGERDWIANKDTAEGCPCSKGYDNPKYAEACLAEAPHRKYPKKLDENRYFGDGEYEVIDPKVRPEGLQ